MSAGCTHKLRKVWFQFAALPGFSGQQEASRLIYSNLEASIWSVHLLPMPAFKRDGGIKSFVQYVTNLVRSWCAGYAITLERRPLLHLNIGQTAVSLMRDVVPALLAFSWRRRRRVVVSIHGSNFMAWQDEALLTRCFIAFIKRAELVTVLGLRQTQRLEKLGVHPDRIRIVQNTTDGVAISGAELFSKHNEARTIRVLYLSSLIDSKGYPEFLEGLLMLARRTQIPIAATLCGPIVLSQFGMRFSNISEAEEWINLIIGETNQSNSVRITWIKGAKGADKWALYKNAHIFVFPSRYQVEAQPLVLVEAMACGCTIITSAVGEIPTILSPSEALFLTTTTGPEVADKIQSLVDNRELRLGLAEAALQRFNSELSLQRYSDTWNTILTEVYNRP